MMLNLPLHLWQPLLKRAEPRGIITTQSAVARDRPIDNGFHSSTHASGSFGLCEPNRLKDRDKVSPIDLGNRLIADNWKDVGGQCAWPLTGVLEVLPRLRLQE